MQLPVLAYTWQSAEQKVYTWPCLGFWGLLPGLCAMLPKRLNKRLEGLLPMAALPDALQEGWERV